MFVGDPLNNAGAGRDVEESGLPDRNTAGVGAGFLAGGDYRPDDVSCLESTNGFLTHVVTARKPEFVEAGPLVAATPHGRDLKH